MNIVIRVTMPTKEALRNKISTSLIIGPGQTEDSEEFITKLNKCPALEKFHNTYKKHENYKVTWSLNIITLHAELEGKLEDEIISSKNKILDLANGLSDWFKKQDDTVELIEDKPDD